DIAAHHAERRVNHVRRLDLADLGESEDKGEGERPARGAVQIAVRVERALVWPVDDYVEILADDGLANDRTLFGIGADHFKEYLVHEGADLFQLLVRDPLIRVAQDPLDILRDFELGQYAGAFLLFAQQVVALEN